MAKKSKKPKKKTTRTLNARAAFAKTNFAIPRVFIIEIDIWNCDVAVGIKVTGDQMCDTLASRGARPEFVKELRERSKEYGDKYLGPGHCGSFYKIGMSYAVMLSTHNNAPISTIGTLVHEMAHVAQFLLRDRGVPLSADNDETFAYLHESLVCKALCHIVFDKA